MEQNREPRIKPTLICSKEARIYLGENTASSIKGFGKTGQLHAKESNCTTFSHHTQKQTQNGSNN